MSGIKQYYYDEQFKRYIVQFMEIFRGLTVVTGKRGDGETRDMPVPIVYGSKDRVTANILHKTTQNSPIRVPTMSAYLSSLNLAPEYRKGIGNIRRETFLPKGGVLPNDVKTVRQLMPVPYTFEIDLNIYTSNTEQQFQILEQILMFFDPTLQIQTSDETFDWTKISIVELVGIRFDETYPLSTERRVITTGLSFKFPVWLSGPSELKNEFVNDIYARITTMSDENEFLEEIFSAMDEEYTLQVSGDEVNDD